MPEGEGDVPVKLGMEVIAAKWERDGEVTARTED